MDEVFLCMAYKIAFALKISALQTEPYRAMYRLNNKILSELKTVIKLKPSCFCPDCGEHFQNKKRPHWFVKAFQSFTGIRKYHCNCCDKTYYVYLGSEVKMDKKFI
jgi:hypothetical protein